MLLDLSGKPPDWLPPIVRRRPDQRAADLGSAAEAVGEARSQPEPATDHELTRTRLWTQTMERRRRRKAQEDEFKRQLVQWNPHSDVNIRGDARSTLFLARLPYDVTAEQITEQFSTYGPIESIRIVGPRRGYAFVVYKPEHGAENAASAVQQTAGGMLFSGRRIITDLERGRLQMGWKPRRLGGGLGGRLSVARQKAEIARANQIMRRGIRPPQQEGRKRPNSAYNNTIPHASSQGPRRGPYSRGFDSQRQFSRDPGPKRPYSGRDYPGRDHPGRDYQGRDHSGQDHSGRDHSGRDQQGRDQSRRYPPRRDQPGRDQSGGGARPGGRILRQY